MRLLEKPSACGSPSRRALGCANNTSWQSPMACDSSEALTKLFQCNPFLLSGVSSRLWETSEAPPISVCAFILMGFFTCILVSYRGLGHVICGTTRTAALLWALYHGLQISPGNPAFSPTFPIDFWALVILLGFQCSGLQQRPNSRIALLACKVVLLFPCLAPWSVYGDPCGPREPGKGRGADGHNSATRLYEKCL